MLKRKNIHVNLSVVNSIYAYYKVSPVNHARWMTLAIRILVLYSRTEHPSPVLKEIVKHIQTVWSNLV